MTLKSALRPLLSVRRSRPSIRGRIRIALSIACSARIEEPPSPSAKRGPPRIGAEPTQWPTPLFASRSQGKCSPGSRLRRGATSECASTRSFTIEWRSQISWQSAITAAICASAKGGQPPSCPAFAISMPIEAELRSCSPFHALRPACHARRASGTNWMISPSFVDEIVRRHLGLRGAQPPKRAVG